MEPQVPPQVPLLGGQVMPGHARSPSSGFPSDGNVEESALGHFGRDVGLGTSGNEWFQGHGSTAHRLRVIATSGCYHLSDLIKVQWNLEVSKWKCGNQPCTHRLFS